MRFGGGMRGTLTRFALLAPMVLVLAAVFATAPRAGTASALDGEEASVLALINNYRAQNGLGALSLDSQLNDTARWMANDMAANNYFSHTDSQGRDPFARMDAFGYTYNTWRGENLAAGSEGAAQAFDLWFGSAGHNANMLGASYTVIGIAHAFDASSNFGWYWATEFGGQTSAPPPPPAPVEPTPAPYMQPPAPVPVPIVPQPTPVPAPPPPAPTIPETATATAVPPPPEGPPWWHSLQALDERWADATDEERAQSNGYPATALTGLLGG